MSVSAKFIADFTSFDSAVTKAENKLRDWQKDILRVDKDLSKMSNAFLGGNILKEATLAANAIERIGGASKLTTSEQQRVNATVTEAIAKYNALGQQAPAHLIHLANATKQVEQSTSLASKAAGVLSSAFGQFTAANLASNAIQGVVTKVGEFVDIGKKLPAVESSFQRLTAGIGQNATQMLRSMDTAADGLVSDFDLMQTANKAMLLGLPVTSKAMGELTATAKTLGKAMGQDATKSLDDLITALGRSSPMILDNLGLTVKLGEANEEYAKKLGKTADELTEGEKKLAFYEAAMEAARKKTAELGEQTKTLGEIVDTIWTRIGNVITRASADINVSLGSALSSGSNFLRFWATYAALGPEAALGAEKFRVEQEKLKKSQVDTNLPMEKAVDLMAQYRERIAMVATKTAALTDAQKELIRQGVKVGDNSTFIAKALGLEEKAVEAVIKADEKAAEAKKKHTAELKKYNEERKKFQSTEFQDLMAASDGILPKLLSTARMDTGGPRMDGFENVMLGGQFPSWLTGNVRQEPLHRPGGWIESAGAPKWGDIGSVVQAAFQGGGSVLNSIGGLAGGGISKAIFGAGGDAGLSGLGGKLASGAAGLFGPAIGQALGSFLPGVGALLGPLLGKGIGALFGKSEGSKTNDMRDDAVKKLTGIGDLRGAQDELRRLSKEAGIADAEVRKLFDTKKTKDFEASFKSVSDKLKTFADEQEADQQRLAAAIQKYGFSLEELGPKLQAQKLNEQAKELIEDWRVLAGAGIDVATVNEKMAESINEFLHTALSVGAEVPSAMRPILQSLVDQGKLFDASGNKIEDLQSAGVTFAETLTQGFDRVIAKLDEFLQRIGMAGSAIAALPTPELGGNSYGGPDKSDQWMGEGYATGTRGRYVEFGAGRNVTLHGKQRVMNEGEESGGNADLMREVLVALRDFPRALAVAAGDGRALA